MHPEYCKDPLCTECTMHAMYDGLGEIPHEHWSPMQVWVDTIWQMHGDGKLTHRQVYYAWSLRN